MKFKINLFETTIHVITNEKKFKKICEKHDFVYNLGDVNGSCLAVTIKGSKHIYIAMFCNRDDILVHECTHASLFILNDIGEEQNQDSELQPYLVQTLFRECKARL